MLEAQVLKEALVVGIAFVIVFSVLHILFMRANKETAMTHKSLFIQTFISAALFHILADLLGFNSYYCGYKK